MHDRIVARDIIKARYPDQILLYRIGDFYESFDDDAAIVHAVCGYGLTKIPGSKRPLCGVPYHAIVDVTDQLVAAGHRVAWAEEGL